MRAAPTVYNAVSGIRECSGNSQFCGAFLGSLTQQRIVLLG